MNIPAEISIGPLTLHFYGLMYASAAIFAYFFTVWLAQKKKSPFSSVDIADAIFWAMICGVLGGRIWYVLLYNAPYFWENPVDVFAVWKGGMSIHGGLLGGVLGLAFFCSRAKKSFWELADLFAPALAMGLFFGRLGNWVNGELMGRVTDVSWGIDYGDGENRHPWPLYAMAKDFFLFLLFFFLSLKKRFSPGVLTALFFSTLALLRFFTEFFRAPDPQLGFLWFHLSLGQWLSLLLLLVALFLLFLRRRKS